MDSMVRCIFVDKMHRLWVANGGANNVLVFARGSTTPATTLKQSKRYEPGETTSRSARTGLAYVADAVRAGGIAVYPPGHTRPTRYLEAELSGAGGDEYFVTCDAAGNVFANGLIGFSPVLATTGWLGGQQSGYVFLSYDYAGGIKATPSGTLLTNGYLNAEPAVVEITESGAATGNSTATGAYPWSDIAINPPANVVFGADPVAHEGLSLGFPSGTSGRTYRSGNIVDPQGIAFDPGG